MNTTGYLCGPVLCTSNFRLMLILALFIIDYSRSNPCGKVQKTFTIVENRALQTFTFREENVNSPFHCVRDCHANSKCRSVNYCKTGHLCQLNMATRDQHLDNFLDESGSLYFDTNEDTPLFTTLSCSSNCMKLMEAGYNRSGLYMIYPDGFTEGLQVYCDMESGGGGWIVIHRRQDGSVNFYRNWTDYQVGFGSLSGEFWLGNENLRILTESTATWQVRVDLADSEKNRVWAEYENFKTSGDNYMLQIGSYNPDSTARDSLTYHNGMMFSTYDKDNDNSDTIDCAKVQRGGWWFHECAHSNLNGIYSVGLRWQGYFGSVTIKKCTMKIRLESN